ncbi:MAG: hypothetical protein IPG89_08290 [Bacteroidetes bacterium]|nr:hypothetical protein [Bacteroidota bacterium]
MTNLEQKLASLQLNIIPFENTIESINENELILSEEDVANDEINHLLNEAIYFQKDKVELVLKSKKAQKDLILNELSEISRLMNKYKISLNLIDYTIPFYYDEKEYSSYLKNKNTQLGEVIAYFLYFKYTDETLTKIEKDLIKEDAFFGLPDVTRIKGKFKYKSLIAEAKIVLKELNLFDSKGKITLLGKEVKESLKQKNINTEKAYKNKGEPCFRIGITKSFLEKEKLELFLSNQK